MNKKYITAVILELLIVVAYLFSGKIINKLYLRGYEKDKIQGANRYETIISCGEGYWDNPKEAILINTNDIGSAMSAVPYAYANNIPLLLTDQGDLSNEIRDFMKESHLKKVYVLGGIRAVSKRVERDVERTGAKVERLIRINRGDISNKFAEMTVKQSKSKEMFVIFDGKNITQLAPNKRQLNTVFQKYALFPNMNVAENIAFGLRINMKSIAYIDDKFKYALKLVYLDGYE